MNANNLNKYFDDLEARGRSTVASRGVTLPQPPYNSQPQTIQMRPDDEMPDALRQDLPTYDVDEYPEVIDDSDGTRFWDLTDQMDEEELAASNKLAQEEGAMLNSPEFLAEYKAEKDRFMEAYSNGMPESELAASPHNFTHSKWANDAYLRKSFEKWNADKKAKEERYRAYPDKYGYSSVNGNHNLLNPKTRQWEKYPHAKRGGTWKGPTDSYYTDRDQIQNDLKRGPDPDRGLGRKQKNKMLTEGLGSLLDQPIPGLVTGRRPKPALAPGVFKDGSTAHVISQPKPQPQPQPQPDRIFSDKRWGKPGTATGKQPQLRR